MLQKYKQRFAPELGPATQELRHNRGMSRICSKMYVLRVGASHSSPHKNARKGLHTHTFGPVMGSLLVRSFFGPSFRSCAIDRVKDSQIS